jgi:hypothetical protein
MRPTKSKARVPGKNLIAIDGTMDRIETIRITILEKGKNAEPFETRVWRRDAVRERVECNNPLCEGGGLALGDLIRELLRGRQNDYIGTSFCTGQEVAHPEVPDHVRSCRTRFDVESFLEFR